MMQISRRNTILNLTGMYSFLGIYPKLSFKHVAVLTGSLTHRGTVCLDGLSSTLLPFCLMMPKVNSSVP